MKKLGKSSYRMKMCSKGITKYRMKMCREEGKNRYQELWDDRLTPYDTSKLDKIHDIKYDPAIDEINHQKKNLNTSYIQPFKKDAWSTSHFEDALVDHIGENSLVGNLFKTAQKKEKQNITKAAIINNQIVQPPQGSSDNDSVSGSGHYSTDDDDDDEDHENSQSHHGGDDDNNDRNDRNNRNNRNNDNRNNNNNNHQNNNQNVYDFMDELRKIFKNINIDKNDEENKKPSLPKIDFSKCPISYEGSKNGRNQNIMNKIQEFNSWCSLYNIDPDHYEWIWKVVILKGIPKRLATNDYKDRSLLDLWKIFARKWPSGERDFERLRNSILNYCYFPRTSMNDHVDKFQSMITKLNTAANLRRTINNIGRLPPKPTNGQMYDSFKRSVCGIIRFETILVRIEYERNALLRNGAECDIVHGDITGLFTSCLHIQHIYYPQNVLAKKDMRTGRYKMQMANIMLRQRRWKNIHFNHKLQYNKNNQFNRYNGQVNRYRTNNKYRRIQTGYNKFYGKKPNPTNIRKIKMGYMNRKPASGGFNKKRYDSSNNRRRSKNNHFGGYKQNFQKYKGRNGTFNKYKNKNRFNNYRNNNRGFNKRGRKFNKSLILCNACEKPGHKAMDCRNRTKRDEYCKRKALCFICCQPDHQSANCPKKKSRNNNRNGHNNHALKFNKNSRNNRARIRPF